MVEETIPVNYSGLSILSGGEQEELKSLVEGIVAKTVRGTKLFSFDLRVKTLHKAGERRLYQFDLHSRIGRKLLTTSAEDWDLHTVTHKVFDEMRKRAEKLL